MKKISVAMLALALAGCAWSSDPNVKLTTLRHAPFPGDRIGDTVRIDAGDQVYDVYVGPIADLALGRYLRINGHLVPVEGFRITVKMEWPW